MAVQTLSTLNISSAGAGTSGGTATNKSEWTSVNFTTSVSSANGNSATETYKLQYSLNGGTTWIDVTTLQASSAQGTAISFNNVNLSSIAAFQNMNGTAVQFRVDVNSNGNRVATTASTTVIDVVAPTAPAISSISDNYGSTANPVVTATTVAPNGTTNDATPTVRVSLANTNAVAGDTVNILVNGTSTGTAVLSAANITANFVDITSTTLSSDGPKSVTATVTDARGNTSTASTARSFTLDTTADTGAAAQATFNPAAVGDGDSIVEGAEARTLNFTIGNVDADAASVQVQFTYNGTTITRALTATGGSFNGNHVVDITALPASATQSAVTTSLRITDAAGNVITRNTDSFQAVICFYPGTLVTTPDGERAVETLASGDLVLTAEGQAAPVRWMGRQTVSTRFGDPARTLPVRIRAGALGEGLPRRDLLVSPGHAMLVDGVLVNAGALVNGVSILVERDVPEVFTYFHVELADQSLILAEGAPAETFLDNAARENFDNWNEHEALPSAGPMRELELPRATSARQVPAATRERLLAVAAGLDGLSAAA